jgi:MoaA/NifB/PqqE/SkfB family radical SAM enzyme
MGTDKTIQLKVESQPATSPLSSGESKCDAGRYPIYSIDDARCLFGDRKLYLWGAGQKGRGFWQALNRCGFKVESFIDSSPEMLTKSFMGVGTISPGSFFALPGVRDNAFVLTASVDIKNKAMFNELQRHGFKRGVSFENIQTLSPFYPTIEVTGLCNLRCSSCIRSDKSIIEDGDYMSYEDYEKVIIKMVGEIPFVYLVDLYVFGEPMLNKDLPRMIHLNNQLGLASGLSTNLYSIRHLKSVLDAYPVQIRVSLSGASAATYDITHTGGKWSKVEKHLQTLAELVAERNHRTIVEVYYHIYKHNQHEIGMIQALCARYGFRFHPSLAVLFSDFALQYSREGTVPNSAKVANDLTLISMECLLQDCRDHAHLNCILTRVVPVINWDLSVMPCCNYAYSKIAPNYLDIPLTDLIHERTHSLVCANCQLHALHRWNNQGFYSDYVARIVAKNTQPAAEASLNNAD